MKARAGKSSYQLPVSFYRLERDVILNHPNGFAVSVCQVSVGELMSARMQIRDNNHGADVEAVPTMVAFSATDMYLFPTPDKDYDVQVVYTEHPKVW